MNEEIETKNQTQKKTCPHKKILGNICLVIILAIFCTLEIAILGLIFSIFLTVYIAILIVGGCSYAYIAIRKIINHHSDDKPTQG